MSWIKLSERKPDPAEHERVLIYTAGDDFDGQQFFDVKTEELIEYYGEPITVPVVCSFATHWMPLPLPYEEKDDEEQAIECVTSMLAKSIRNGGKYILCIEMNEPRGSSVIAECGYDGENFAVARALERFARNQRRG